MVMKTKLILIGFAIGVLALVLFANIIATTSLAQGQTTPTVVWPPATHSPNFYVDEAKKLWNDFPSALQVMEIDLTCYIPCWSNFTPSVTSMSDIIQFFNRHRLVVNPDSSIPNNVIGIDGLLLKVKAYGDTVQPQPLLRAYRLSIPIARFRVPITEILPLLPNSVANLLPTARLALPNAIPVISVGRSDSSSYLVTFEYENWTILYRLAHPDNKTSLLEACPQDILMGIEIWVYSNNEQSFHAMLESVLQNYPRLGGDFLSSVNESITFQTLDTQAFKEARQAGKCLPLASQ